MKSRLDGIRLTPSGNDAVGVDGFTFEAAQVTASSVPAPGALMTFAFGTAARLRRRKRA